MHGGVAGLICSPQDPSQAAARSRDFFINNSSARTHNFEAGLAGATEEVRVLTPCQRKSLVERTHSVHDSSGNQYIPRTARLNRVPGRIDVPAEECPLFHPLRNTRRVDWQNWPTNHISLETGSGPEKFIEPSTRGEFIIVDERDVVGILSLHEGGWDSYFIIRGLLRSERTDLAKGMVENFFYEIEHYGGVLNANRTYYLGRSQPPFLSSMILAVYSAQQAAGAADIKWIERAYSYAVKDYEQWAREPHLAGDTGLSRYFDEGEGPVPEIRGDPSDYYRGVAHYFLIHEGLDSPHLVPVDAKHPPESVLEPIFQVYTCDTTSTEFRKDSCRPADRVALARDAYKGDRSMRESGFDVSFRFGPYGIETHHYAPVCLNSLLYKTEKDLEEMSRLLGRTDDARRWHETPLARQERITKYLWDQDLGLFFDYNFVTHSRSSYEYATTFYPLWAGLASKEQARAVAANLTVFEQAGGLAMSRYESQAQWDYPYGWAPIHLLAVEGLRRYGYATDADRITYKFLSMVLRNFRRDDTIREKYDVVSRSTETHIGVGYAQNVDGFGWTNAVFLELLHESPATIEVRLSKE